jgi:hypothetical protein
VPDEWYPGTWGQAILSRHPIESTAIHHGGWEGQAFLEACVEVEGRTLTMLGAHTMRPGKARRILARRQAFAARQPELTALAAMNARCTGLLGLEQS